MKRRTLAVCLVASLVMSGVASMSAPAAGFGDVGAGTFYTDAVQWMVDNDITTGVSPNCFGPDEPVTRGQAAAFMWRMEDSPEPAVAHGFGDVVASWQQDPPDSGTVGGVAPSLGGHSFRPAPGSVPRCSRGMADHTGGVDAATGHHDRHLVDHVLA